MIVSLKQGADVARVVHELAACGVWVRAIERARSGSGGTYCVVGSHSAAADPAELARIDGVLDVATPAPLHPLVSRQAPILDVAGVRIGGASPVWFCGPCSVESEERIRAMARALASVGVAFLRGGAFKPRSSPYAFQGHGERALGWLRQAATDNGLRVVTEALSEHHVGAVAEHADLIQVGSRTMHSYALLKAVGKAGKPVLLKRGLAATIEEWLLAGEYVLQAGAPGVVFCERGVRGFDESTRNVLDLGAVALLAHVHRQPVIADPSHGTGRRDLVGPLGRAALAAGAAGLMIETHDDPASAQSDGPQAIPLAELPALLASMGGLESRLLSGSRSDATAPRSERSGAARGGSA